MTERRFNAGYRYRCRVGPAGDGDELAAYLARRFTHSSAATWRARIAAGELHVDGRLACLDHRTRSGERLTWERPPWMEPPVPRTFDVIHGDDDLLAVNKPAGLPTLPGGGFLEHTLLHLVRLQVPDAVPLHRLGRWTSGLVLFALSRQARESVAEQLRERRLYKRYRALASGRPPSRRFVIGVPIGQVPHPRLRHVWAAVPQGKAATTRIEVVETRPEGFLADAFPISGRPHQIRIHLAAVGHPLLGDPLYPAGGRPPFDGSALPGDPGYRLHAVELRLTHPAHAREQVLVCPPPPSLNEGGA